MAIDDISAAHCKAARAGEVGTTLSTENLNEAPWVFVSGRRGQLAMHSHELTTWMGVDNNRAHWELIWQNGDRPESWWIGNCWNRTAVPILNHNDGMFTVRESYWISESVAMKLCRTFRKDLLADLREMFAQARQEDIERQLAFTGRSPSSQYQEVQP